jgi:positive regulator of sigma E activity
MVTTGEVWVSDVQMSCQGRSCKEHEMCGDEVLKEDVVVRLRTV